MKKSTSDRLLRIPVRYIEGQWECGYGGLVPVSDHTEGELLVETKSISDKGFLARMREKGNIKVLDQGAKLFACLATKDQVRLSPNLKETLIPWDEMLPQIDTHLIGNWSSGGISLVEISIGDPTDQQSRKFETKDGGLWLLTEGPKAVGLQSSRICLPRAVSEEPVDSLNHAFTKLSEAYEPWRISHTGNVYQRLLYQEKDGKWHPLDLLRNAALAKKEQEIAHNLWQDFMKKMSAGSTGRGK